MADFPALGGASARDRTASAGLGGAGGGAGGDRGPAGERGPAGGLNGMRSGAPTVDFTIDDFPALTLGGSSSANTGGGPTQQSQLPDLRPPLSMQERYAAAFSGTGTANGIRSSSIGSLQDISPLGAGTAFGGPSVLSMPAGSQQSSTHGRGGLTGSQPASSGASAKRPVGEGSVYANKAPHSDGSPIRSSTSTDFALQPLSGGPTPIPPAGISDKYGLYGLIDMIRLTDPDANMIHLGCDLTSLGLDLATNDPLYATFMSPFSDHPTLGGEPQFALPGCYNLLQPPPPPISKVSTFSDETLFYVFYAQPRDSLQEAAAQELFNRSWRFHKELKLWESRDRSPITAAAEQMTKGIGFERRVFVFFDPGAWARVRKEWVVYYDQLEERGVMTPGASAEDGDSDDALRQEQQAPPGSVTAAMAGGFGDRGDLPRGPGGSGGGALSRGTGGNGGGWTQPPATTLSAASGQFYASGLSHVESNGSSRGAVSAGR
ncbi:hypothetical protein HDU87_005766 [Geranomyces variabilis]|uniref:NOT2/NOT3/NOT5 C-terminal domain-containing protein n=1 Tax=Geranomyces variabilis TaxID=109894 RepID=A0AAD5TIR9_9FUNG|nr:hypothetical protein HDU87_005766 [Geranomyces variabilis]